MGLLGRAFLEVIGLFKQILLQQMSLFERTEIALRSLLERKLRLLMSLPGRTELVLTALKINLQTNFTIGLSGLQMELPTDTLQGNMRKSSCLK